MSDEIKVRIFKYPDRKNLVMRYDDPITGQAGHSDRRHRMTRQEAIGNAAVWQDELNTGRYVARSDHLGGIHDRYKAEKASHLSKGSSGNIAVSFGQVARLLTPIDYQS